MASNQEGRREYLGDGVYADFDGYQVWVFTHDGYRTTERIALPNDGTFTALMRYAARFYPGFPTE